MPMGVIGDPYLQASNNTTTEFVGIVGSSYTFASDITGVKVVFRIAAVPNAPGKQMVDLVTITVPMHTVAIGLSTLLIDGKTQVKTSSPITMATGSVWWHTGAAGETRVDVDWGSWKIAVIQDPGTSALHALPSPLHNVLHLGLFIDQYPPMTLGGILASLLANLPVIPSSFLVV